VTMRGRARFMMQSAACLAWTCSTLLIAAPPAVLSSSELKVALSTAQGKITSVRFDYWTADPYSGDKAFPSGTYLRRIVSAKAPNLFSHETAHGSDQLPWEKDPRRRHCIVEDNRAFDIWVTNRAYNKTAVWKSDAPLPGSMPGEPIILCTGIWPLTARPAPKHHEHPIVLRDVAERDQFSVRPELEAVDGHWCHVLEEPAIDCLWLDVQRGCALLARNLHDLTTGALSERYELSGHREIKPDIWLPSKVRLIRYDYLATEPAQRERIISDYSMHISEACVNDVPDSTFVFRPEPGALWLNPPKEQSVIPIQTHPGGTDHLDELVAWAKPILPQRGPVFCSWQAWFAAGVAGVGLFFVAGPFFRLTCGRQRRSVPRMSRGDKCSRDTSRIVRESDT
jgi:hypothetical protein